MPRKEIHVTPHGKGEWQAKQPGASRASVVGTNKEDVMKRAREIARNQSEERVEHDRHGVIIGSDSYGHDPNPPKDKD